MTVSQTLQPWVGVHVLILAVGGIETACSAPWLP